MFLDFSKSDSSYPVALFEDNNPGTYYFPRYVDSTVNIPILTQQVVPKPLLYTGSLLTVPKVEQLNTISIPPIQWGGLLWTLIIVGLFL